MNQDGEPCPARVVAKRWGHRLGSRSLISCGQMDPLTDGRFELHVDDPPVDYLYAELPRSGVAVSKLPPRDWRSPLNGLTMNLEGSGSLRGRLIDETGRPAAGVELHVGIASLFLENAPSAVPEFQKSDSLVEGGGRAWTTVTTKENGAFRVMGLRNAPYVVRTARKGQTNSGLLTKAPVQPEGQLLTIEHKRPYLAVQLFAPTGAQLSGSELECVSPYRSRGLRAWPKSPRIQVLRCEEGPTDTVSGRRPLGGGVIRGDEAVFELDSSGGEYWIAVLGGNFDGEPQRVHVPTASGRVEVTFHGREAVVTGRAKVTLESDRSAIPEGAVHSPEFDLYLERLDSGVVVLAQDEQSGRGPHSFNVPIGQYRLVAEGVPVVDSYHGQLFLGRVFGRTERTIELKRGENLDVTLRLPVGGFLKITVNGVVLPEDRAAVLAEEPVYGQMEHAEESLENVAKLARLELAGPARTPEPVYRTMQLFGYPSLTHQWVLGATQSSEMLPVGNYELVARMRGGRIARSRVEIRSGEVTEVTLTIPQGTR